MRSRVGNRLLASYAAWKNRTTGVLWSWREDRLIDRHARILARGGYRSSRVAAELCRTELEVLRKRHPGAFWSAVPRTLNAVRTRVMQRGRALGGRWTSSHWSRSEDRIAERHVHKFLGGQCASVKQAAWECKRELDRALGRPGHRPFHGVYGHIIQMVRKDGWSKPDGYWSPQERRVTARYARGVVNGRYPSANAAARVCLEEFDRLRRRRPSPPWLARRRKVLGISRVVCEQARSFGQPGRMPDWSPVELRRADRLARAIMTGRCADAAQAARLFRREAGRTGVRRTFPAAHGKILERARLLGYVSDNRWWLPVELTVLNQYVRDLDAGRYESSREAARLCLADLERLRAAGNRRLQHRTLAGIAQSLRQRSVVRGRRWRPFWSAAEVATLEKWVCICQRRRQSGRPGALSQAADGLRRDLARSGSRRSRSACVHRLAHRQEGGR